MTQQTVRNKHAREARDHLLIVSLHYGPEPTGNAPYVVALAEGLASRGHRVSVITTHPHYPSWRIADGYGEWTRREIIHGVSVTRVRHYVPARPTMLRRVLAEASFGLRAAFINSEAATVMLVSPGLMSSAIARLRWRRRNLLVWVQDLYTLGARETQSGGGLASALLSKIERLTFRAPAQIITIHERFSRWVQTELGVDPSRARVIRNWTHLAIPDATGGADVSEQLTRAATTTVLHAGNQGLKQGLENVVNAAICAHRRELPIRFVLLGDGNQNAKLRELASNVPTLEFVPPLDDAEYVAAMRQADILLVNELPGVSGMSVPSKLTSYFAMAKPIIAACDAGGVTAEEIAISQAGLVVTSGDAGALVDAIMRLRSDPGLATTLASNGPRYMERHLSQSAALSKFEALLGHPPHSSPQQPDNGNRND